MQSFRQWRICTYTRVMYFSDIKALLHLESAKPLEILSDLIRSDGGQVQAHLRGLFRLAYCYARQIDAHSPLLTGILIS